jgi:hypothetical protein
VKSEELNRLIRISYDHVGKYGRGGARIYHAVVALDEMAILWRKRALEAGWQEPVDESADDR